MSNSLCYVAYQLPKRVIFAEGNIFFNAAGTLPEKAGRTAKCIYKIFKTLNQVGKKIESK